MTDNPGEIAERLANELVEVGMGNRSTIQSLVHWLLMLGVKESEIANDFDLRNPEEEEALEE